MLFARLPQEVIEIKPSWLFSRDPDMKIIRRAACFCGTKEKREENEEVISMGKKANAFFYPGSSFLFPPLLSS
jgi:hypothetical protein